MATRTRRTDRLIECLEAASRETLRIKDCRSKAELVRLVRALIRYCGLEHFFFISWLRDEAGRESLRYLIGCDPVWAQLYDARRWHAIDPFLERAARSSNPILFSEIHPESLGQAEMLTAAARYGFRSGMVIPAHWGAQERIGILYVGSEKPPAEIEARLTEHRILLRDVAMELYEWWQARLQAEAMVELKFDGIDLQLLRLEHQGYTSEQIRALSGYTLSRINSRFRRINEKLNVHSKKQAAEKALLLGVLRD